MMIIIFFYLAQGHVFTCAHLFFFLVGWFVIVIAQKLLNRFPRNLTGRLVSAQNRHHLLKMQEFFLTFFNNVR